MMKARKILPEIKFGKKVWLVDAEEYCLTDSEDKDNRVSGYDLRYSGKGYAFLYSIERMNIIRDTEINEINNGEQTISQQDILYVHIPHFAKMDPVGTMIKYNLSYSECIGGNDHQIMWDRKEEIIRQIEKSKLLDDYIFQEQDLDGKGVVEIEMVDFLSRKFRLFKSIMEATPGLIQFVGKDIARIKDFNKRSVAEKTDSSRFEIKYFKR